MPSFQILPNYRFPSVVERETLNQQSAIDEVQLSVCALNEPLRFGYGLNNVGALLLQPIVYQNDLLLPFIIGRGPINSVESLTFDAEALPGSITSHLYLGGTGQAVDAWLAAAWAANSPARAYTDTLDGIAWGVLRVPRDPGTTIGNLIIQAKMLKVRQTEAGARVYSTNPAYALADFLASTEYGRGETLDWATVATVAAINDQTVGGQARRAFGVMIDSVRPLDAIEETLRAYAGCWIVREGGVVRLVPDAAASPVFDFTDATGSANYVADSLRLTLARRKDTPTVVTVMYTDTTVKPWREASYAEYAPGVVAGTTPWREEVVSMPGIQDAHWARREALRRLNEYSTSDLSATLTSFGEAAQLRRGDVVTVTDSQGLTAKPFRLVGHQPTAPGMWAEMLKEYDATVYSDAVATVGSSPDTTWPSPGSPPTMGAITLVEEVYQLATGIYASRIRATWAAVAWPFLAHYRITVTSGGAVIDTATLEATATSYATPAVREGVSYQVDVQIVSSTLAAGPAASNTLVPAGKALIPGDVPTLTGFEAGGKVFLYWGAAADLDIWRYEIRYGLAAGSWATATVVDRVDALAYVVNGTPAGDWRFYVKAIDSIRQYSTNAKTLDLTVTLDAGAFLLGTKVFDDIGAPTLTSMTAYTARPSALTYYVTDFGDGLGYGADNTNNSVGTFGDSLVNTVFANPHTAGTSKYVTPSWDIGQAVSGNFTGTITYTVVSGSVSYWIETSPDNSSWTQWSGGSAKTTARYVRLRLETTGTMIVESGCSARIDASPREENGTITTAASGASTVTLSFKYTSAKSIQLTPKGTTSRQAIYDNVVVHPTNPNTFDVYLFNAAGTQIAGDVSWLFQGI